MTVEFSDEWFMDEDSADLDWEDLIAQCGKLPGGRCEYEGTPDCELYCPFRSMPYESDEYGSDRLPIK